MVETLILILFIVLGFRLMKVSVVIGSYEFSSEFVADCSNLNWAWKRSELEDEKTDH